MSVPDSPITREEQFLNVIAGSSGPLPDVPLTRKEQYLAKIAGQDVELPDVPLTREEMYLAEIAENGGGGEAVLINKSISANGTYNASSDSADGYKKVTVSVPNTYAAGDEGKVVSSGALVAQTAHAQVTQNGVVDTTTNNSVEVAVPAAVLTTKAITQNGTYAASADNADGYSSVTVNTNALSVSTGTITLQDSDVDTLTIPVDTSGFTHVYAIINCAKTGTVSGGTVTYDDVPTPDAGSSVLIFGGYIATKNMFPAFSFKNASGAAATSFQCDQWGYCHAYSGRNLSFVRDVTADTNVINSNGISFAAMNATRKWCRTGVYMEFSYTVYGW